MRIEILQPLRNKSIALPCVFAYVGVFIVPWFVPLRQAPIFSDSLAAGFNNRVAVIALVGVCVALFVMQLLGSRRSATTPGFDEDDSALVSAVAPPKGERISGWALALGFAFTLAVVGIGALLLGNQPHGDAAYFCDRLFRMVAGELPYADFEFSYGPLLIYGPWYVYRLIGTPLSVGIYASYYLWVAFAYAVALGIVAYVVNRVRMPQQFRNGAFLLIAAVTVLNPTLGVNYSAARFMIPYALLLWVLWCVTESNFAPLRWFAPLVAMGVATLITPEMGIALLAALVVALGLLAVRDARAHLVTIGVLVLGVGGYVLFSQAGGTGTLGAIAGGAFYLPVLPGPTALLFVASALLASWGMGAAFGGSSFDDQATQLGWLALVAVLVVPVFGRADFMHIFWNGIGVMLVAVPVVERRWRFGGVYLLVAALTFSLATVFFSLNYSATPYVDGLKRVFYQDETRAARVSRLRGQDAAEGLKRSRRLARLDEKQKVGAKRLAEIPRVAFAALLWNRPGRLIAESGNLVPLYSFPGNALTAQEFERSIAELDAAQNLVIPTREYVDYRSAAKKARRRGSVAGDIVMAVPKTVGTPGLYGVLQGAAISLPGRNPVFDPVASFGLVMDRDWLAYDTIEGHTWLKRR